MEFKYPEYEQFFRELLCEEDEELSKYAVLFHQRESTDIKRRGLSSSNYKKIWSELEEKYGKLCQLQFSEFCEIDNPTCIDHVIPLISNELNKKIKGLGPRAKGKKVASESFGSNDISNLILACGKCNSNKKQTFLSREAMRRILKTKGF